MTDHNERITMTTTPEPIEGAVVEIIDTFPTGSPLTPQTVRVNGVDVGRIAAGGVSISELSDKEPVTVTLTLLPSRVEIRHVDHES